MLAGPLSYTEFSDTALLPAGGGDLAVCAGRDPEPGLLARLEAVPDPRSARGRRYRLSTLLAIAVCALSTPGHDSLTAAAEWGRRASQAVLARLRAPYDPFCGRYLAPDEGTLREALARVDPGALAAAGFAHLKDLIAPEAARLAPDGVKEREQRRTATAAHQTPGATRPARRVAYAVDGKCLRSAYRPDGSQVNVLSVVRHRDALTAASREIAAKTNEIPEFPRLLDQLPDAEVAGAVFTLDALHAQRGHAVHLVEARNAHYLVTVKDNQPTLAAQLRALPWKQLPVLHHSTARGHGRQEQRLVQVATVSNLLFPHARQVIRVVRKRRKLGAKRWSTQTVYAITDLSAEQASTEELAGWLRGHWIIENSAHWIRDVVFGEDASKVRTRNAPAVRRDREGRGVSVSPRTEKTLFDAMHRLIQGRAQRTDGKMTKENLYREAGVSRATMNRATAVMAAWDQHVAAHGRRTVGEARRDADLAALEAKLREKTRQSTELQRRLDAAATVIAALHHDNQALREQLARSGGTVVTLARRARTPGT